MCGDIAANCKKYEQFCPKSPSKCSLNSNDQLCVLCRSTCGTCSESMLKARKSCTDGTSSDLQGNFNGRTVVTPKTKSKFTGSPYCDGSNTITDCSAAP